MTVKTPRSASAASTATSSKARPHLHQSSHETQAFGQLVKLPIALAEQVCTTSVDLLNQLLADTMTLRDLYKKHHWQVSGPTFNALHLLYDKHHDEQVVLVDLIAERIQLLGGITLAMGADVCEVTLIPRAPRGREEVPAQLSRLLEAHELIILATRSVATHAADSGDLGTNDLLAGTVLRTNELQVWFLSEHLVSMPLVKAT